MGNDFEIKAEGKNAAGVSVIRGTDEDIMSQMVEKYGFAGVLLNLQDQLDTDEIMAADMMEYVADLQQATAIRKLKNRVRKLILQFNQVYVP